MKKDARSDPARFVQKDGCLITKKEKKKNKDQTMCFGELKVMESDGGEADDGALVCPNPTSGS